MKDSKGTKSNKIKKQQLRAKRERTVRVAQPKPVRQIPILRPRIDNITLLIAGSTGILKEFFSHFVKCRIELTREVRDKLEKFSKFKQHQVRPVTDWVPRSYNEKRQLSSFVRHLYGKYRVPGFMDNVWDGPEYNHHWFIHVAQGYNIRTIEDLPTPLTKKEAHYMMQSPKDFTVLQAIRYGQILNIGGDENLVRQIFKTRIATDFNRNDFWMSVFRWLLQNPMLDSTHYAPIIDYIYNQKFVPYRVDDNGDMICPQPNLTMKGRDPETLLAQVEIWHKQLGKAKNRPQFTAWAISGIKGLYWKTDSALYTIKELCTHKDLCSEGHEMHHCVGSYAGSCASGRISIWSFEELNKEGKQKRLTIEVNNTDKMIVQARGKYNTTATHSDRYWLNVWAKDAKLSISRYLI